MKNNSAASSPLNLINQYLPKRNDKPPGTLIQGRISPELAEALRERLRKDRCSILEWMEASVRAYINNPELFHVADMLLEGQTPTKTQDEVRDLESSLQGLGLQPNDIVSFMRSRPDELLNFTPYELIVMGRGEKVLEYIKVRFGSR